MSDLLRLHPTDNCSVIVQGERFGAKIATQDMPAGASVRKYGNVIGQLLAPVKQGELIHTHNLRSLLQVEAEYRYEPAFTPEALKAYYAAPAPQPVFSGYARTHSRAGIRNELWILNTVSCVNTLARRLVRDLELGRLPAPPDGVVYFEHPFGCSQVGEDLDNLTAQLANLARHPNAGAVLLLGLGCENLQMKRLRAQMEQDGGFNAERVRFLTLQEEGDELEAAQAAIHELSALLANDARSPQRASELVIGVKCGGSDSLSGITANPLIGRMTDLLCRAGGGVILGEIPEIFGAEQGLMNRCQDAATFEKLRNVVTDFKAYFARHNCAVYENPSPGNKEGGITTLEEKSCGATQKSGGAPVMEVLRYRDRKQSAGLSIMDTPGNDLVSSTALAAAGAQLLLFSTGRGTPLAPVIPTMKIASNSALAQKKSAWIDFDAGRALQSGLDTLEAELWAQLLSVASGERRCRNEESFTRDFGFFKSGVFL